MPTGPGVVPPSSVPPSFPDDYARLAAVNGNNVITTDESSVTISGISDGIGASIITYLVAYDGGEGEPDAGSTIAAESNTVTVTDLGYTDYNGNEVGTYSAILPTAGLAPGIYVAESFLEFPNGGNTVYDESGPDSKQVVSVAAPSTQTLPATIELSGTNAEITTDGQYLVYTAINEYNEPEITGDVYERNLQTGAEVDLTATGQAPTGVFAVNHLANGTAYPTFTSANGGETFSTINDFDVNPDGGGYNPLPVVTNAAGIRSVIGGIGANKFDMGAATAVSDDGSVVLSEETYEVQYGATGASFINLADPQIYVSFLGASGSNTDVFSDNVQATTGPLAFEYLWSNAANWSEGIPVSGASATLSGQIGIDDVATLSLASLDTGRQGAYVTGNLLVVNTVTIGMDYLFEADSERTGSGQPVSVIIGTVASTSAIFQANGAGASLEILDNISQAEEYWATDGGRMILDDLNAGSGFDFRDGIGTLALAAPGETISGSVSDIAPGDVLELPGDAVSEINFGNTLDSVTTLSIITSAGVYVFTEAGYDGVHGYTAAPDSSTGLEAITFTAAATAPAGPDVFSDSDAASSGQFLWSNAGNWSNGIPADGDAASLTGSGIDDLAALSLSTLISNGEVTSVDGTLLSVSTLVADSASGLVANSSISGGSSTVSVLLGTVTGSGGLFVADGAHAGIEILSGGLPAEIYQAEAGGRIILDSLASGSKFGFVGEGTLALALPDATTTATISGFGIGDVLELPGTTVSGFAFGASSLTITTDTGAYDFTNVDFGAGVGAITSGVDPATGLEAITLAAALQFQDKAEFNGAEPLNGVYLWNDPGNWAAGAIPQNGDIVVDSGLGAAYGIDIIDNLSLSALTLGSGNDLDVVGEFLTIGNLLNQGLLIAQGGAVDPAVTIVVNGVTEPASDAGLLMADGQGAVVIDNVAINTGELISDGGGLVEINAAPGAAALNYDGFIFGYFNGPASFALSDPGATITTALMNVERGDVLELPGDNVSAVHFGTASLTITTSTGTYDFTNVSYEGSVTGYVASLDAATGLEAITFTGAPNPTVDVFDGNIDHANFMTLTGELWSTDDNWEDKVPRNGDAVQISTTGFINLDGDVFEDPGVDDIGTLSLSSMSVLADGLLLVAQTLTVGSLSIVPGGTVGSQNLLVVQGNTENDGEIDAYSESSGNAVTVVFDGAVNGSGSITLQEGDVAIHGSIGAGQSIAFTDGGVLALYDPGSIVAGAILDLNPRDVLELPGTAVANIAFGTGEIAVTTSSGVYDFTNVTYGGIGGYTAAKDSSTGLMAITFNAGPPVYTFQDKNIYNDGVPPLNGVYLWGDGNNWAGEAVPANGDDVSDSAYYGVDDINNLSLNALTLATGSAVDVIGGNLTVANMLNDGLLIAEGNVLGAATIFINGVIAGGSSSLYIADGQGGVLIDNAPINTGELLADGGGMVEINSAPGAAGLNYNSTFFGYYNGPGTFALSHPGATVASLLQGVEREDVLELPGSSVSAVHFGANSLTITTNAGTYDFTNVDYDGSVTGYTAGLDAATGLEAITFTGAPDPAVDLFEGMEDHGDYPTLTGELWSTDENWASQVPRNGDAIEISTTGYIQANGQSIADPSVDDIAGLSLSSMTVDAGTNLVIAEPLTLGALVVVSGTNFYDQSVITVDGTTLNDGQINTDPSSIIFKGAVFGTGTVVIGAGSNVVVDAAVAAGETFDFTDSTGTLTINDASDFSGKIIGSGKVVGGGSIADTFSEASAGAGGAYNWSNPANWSQGVPGNGTDVAMGTSGTDDISGLSLAALTLTTPAGVESDSFFQIKSGLSVSSLTIGDRSFILVASAGTENVLDIGKITLTAASENVLPTLEAQGAGSVIDDRGSVNPAVQFIADEGGLVEIAGPVSAGAVLSYGEVGTFALFSQPATTAAELNDVASGDVLEATAAAVENVIFGTSSLTIVTSNGDLDFSNVSFAGAVDGYIVNRDAATGLEAITFLEPDVFSDIESNPSVYDWSNHYNWSLGIPGTNGDVDMATSGTDDIAGLSLAALTLTTPAGSGSDSYLAINSGLSVSSLTIGDRSFINVVSAGTANVLDIGNLTITAGSLNVSPALEAQGAGSVIDDRGSVNPAVEFIADEGGMVEIAGPVNAGDVLSYGGVGTFALFSPLASTAALLNGVSVGDVLETTAAVVKNVIFGASSLTIVTANGTLDYSNVSFASAVDGYSTSHDASTGLEAITFTGPDVFSETAANDGQYLWSNASNWSQGVPANHGEVDMATSGVDDIAGLTLSKLIVTTPSGNDSDSFLAIKSGLSVSSLSIGDRSFINVVGNGATNELSIDQITLIAGGDVAPTLEAQGAGAFIDDHGSFNPAVDFIADEGGVVELAAAPNAGSALIYGGIGTFELLSPSATTAAALDQISPGDILEFPAASVENVIFGTSSFTIVTGNGNLDFSNVSYAGPVDGYSTSRDATTGLEVITFTGPDVFSDTAANAGQYLWSNASNWSQGVPANLGEVAMATSGVDDIAGLTLSKLTLTTPSAEDDDSLLSIKSGLSVSSLSIGSRSFIDVVGNGAANELSIGQITLIAGGANVLPTFEAEGAGAFIDDQGSLNPAVGFIADEGGVVELAGAPNAASELMYSGLGTFELLSPQAVNAGKLAGVAAGDVLELPGQKVDNVVFGATSLTITTDKGVFDFSNVSYDGAVEGYSSGLDDSTGLQAITFSLAQVADVFADDVTNHSGQFFWSNANNWSIGVPVNGSAVDLPVDGTDDIANLTLSSLNVTGGTLVVTGDLNAGAMTVTPDAMVDDLGTLVVAGQLVNNGLISTDPSTATFDGAVTGTGTIVIGAGSDVIFNSSVSAGQVIDFLDNTGTLTVNDAADFAGKIIGSGVEIGIAGAADVFMDNDLSNGFGYPWSNAANWSQGVPADGDAVIGSGIAVDDIASLSLSSVELPAPTSADTSIVAGYDELLVFGSLAVGALTLAHGSMLEAEGEPVADPVTGSFTVLIGTVNIGGIVELSGTGALPVISAAEYAIVDDNAASNPQLDYSVASGGMIELGSAPNAGSVLNFDLGTYALAAPGPVIAATLSGLATGDVLELPGATVESVVYGASSLTITTDKGVFDFTHVSYSDAVSGYVSKADAATGLEAITFGTQDVFTEKDEFGFTAGWSDAGNWSSGVPANNASVYETESGTDDIASLSLAAVTLISVTNFSKEDQLTTDGDLTVGTLTFGSQTEILVQSATLTISSVRDADNVVGSLYQNDGAIYDEAAVNPALLFEGSASGGMFYIAGRIAAGSTLEYDPLGTSRFALANPGSVITAGLGNFRAGDVLELPGATVEDVIFGETSLTVTTDKGVFDFTNVGYDAPVAGYVASVDSATGLEAITFTAFNTFVDLVSSAQGYVWSNAGNWSQGVPADGAAVLEGGDGVDDIGALSLSKLELPAPSSAGSSALTVDGASLAIGQLILGRGSVLEADPDVDTNAASIMVSFATVSIGSIIELSGTGALPVISATGHAFIDDNAASNPQLDYAVASGGMIELGSAPNAGSVLNFALGTYALAAPGPVIAATLSGVGTGDVLELPGAAVESVVYGASSLTITTDKGVFDFTHVGYAGAISGYVAKADAATGLEAITLGTQDVFTEKDLVEFDANWSDAGNWSNGVPANGASVYAAESGTDDIASLSLAALTVASDPGITDGDELLIFQDLTVGTLTLGLSNQVVVQGGTFTFDKVIDAGGAVGSIVQFGNGPIYDEAAVNPALNFVANANNQIFYIAGSIGDGSSFELDPTNIGGAVKVAFANPGSIITAAFTNVGVGNVLELPGATVKNVIYGATSLTITTDKGNFDFTDVSYFSAVNDYTASLDAATGLVAITLTDVAADVFGDNVTNHSGQFYWSNFNNWSSGVPANGGVVETGVAGTDDIANLTLQSLTISGSQLLVTGELEVASLYLAAGATISDLNDVHVTGAFVNDGVVITDPSTIIIDGPLTGTGTIQVGAGSDVIINGSVSSGETIVFVDNTGTLTINDPTLFQGTIAGSGTTIVNGMTITPTGSIDTSLVVMTTGHDGANTEFGNGGAEFLEAGAASSNITLAPGGVQGVLIGATASSTTISGGVQGVAGTAINTQIEAGYQIVGAYGESENTSIHDGGYEYVLIGGTADNTTIGTGGIMVVGTYGEATGSITFAGSDAVLSLAGTNPPAATITGFDQFGATDDAIILSGSTYVAGHDTATLGAGNILTLDLNGTIEKLAFDPGQSNAGHSFALTTDSLDQVVIIDPTTGSQPNMDFLAPATQAGSPAVVTQVLSRSAALILDLFQNNSESPSFQPALKNFAAIDTLASSPPPAISNLSAFETLASVYSMASKLLAGHPV